MNRMRMFLAGAVAAFVLATPASGQNFKGEGKDATQRFVLGEGLAIFEVQHKGPGEFTIRLLDEQGNVIGEVAKGIGDFGGAKALQIPRTGYYLFDVDAPGEWSIRLRNIEPAANGEPDPAAERGAEAGRTDGGKPGTTGWLGRGLIGGLLLGPIGTAIAVNRAGESAAGDAQVAANALELSELSYITAYRNAYSAELRRRRMRSALLGGAVGTGVLVFAIFQAVNLGTSSADTQEPPVDNPPFIVIPLFTISR